MDDNTRDYGIEFYWDIDTTSLPDGYNVSTIANQIQTALKSFEDKYYLREMIIYGDLSVYGGPSAFSPGNTNAIINATSLPKRIPLCADCKNNRDVIPPKEDLSHFRLKEHIYHNTQRVGPPYTILMATSDADFIPTIRDLIEMEFKVLLAHQFDASRALRMAVPVAWLWGSMINGGEVVPEV